MEYSKNIRVIPVDIDWNDIGSFNAFDEIFPKDENGNVIRGQKIRNLDSKDNIVISDDVEVSLLGVSDLVIVKEKNKLLITRKDRTQDIKKILLIKSGIFCTLKFILNRFKSSKITSCCFLSRHVKTVNIFPKLILSKKQ